MVSLGPLVSSLDATVVNLALAPLSRELHASLAVIQWVSSGYLLALALVLPMSGWLVDRLGAKPVYLGGFAMFSLASLLCGTAHSTVSLISFRLLQGASGGVLAPMAQMMLARTAGRHLTRVMSIVGGPVMLGPILGPPLAGVLLQHAGWHSLFLINVPIGAIGTILAWRVLPDDVSTNASAFDLTGFLLLGPALAILLHGLEQVTGSASSAPLGACEIATAAILLGAFTRHSLLHGRSALIDVRLFVGRTFRVAAATQFLSNCISFGGQLLMPLYLLMLAQKSPGSAGTLLAPAGLGMLCAFPAVAGLTERFGPRWVSAGGACVALLSTLPFAFPHEHGLGSYEIGIAFFLRGAGMSCINIPCLSAVYAILPKDRIPTAATAINIVQRLGGPMATTGLATWLHHALSQKHAGMQAAFLQTFWILCALHVLTAILAVRLPAKIAVRRGSIDADDGGELLVSQE